MSRLGRITSDPAICRQPTVRELRYTVKSLLELLSVGERLADYPDLERDDVVAALEFGALAA